MKKLALALMLLVVLPAFAALDPLMEVRTCGEPRRMADGSILRRADVLTAFQKAHPCPVTGKTTGACQGWAIDHVIPLACGGCDAVWNLQWLPNSIKSAAGALPKDRWERKINCQPAQLVTLP